MCYERRSRRMREQAQEEGRRIWDLFDRETREEPPQPVAEAEAREEGDRRPVEPNGEPVVTRR